MLRCVRAGRERRSAGAGSSWFPARPAAWAARVGTQAAAESSPLRRERCGRAGPGKAALAGERAVRGESAVLSELGRPVGAGRRRLSHANRLKGSRLSCFLHKTLVLRGHGPVCAADRPLRECFPVSPWPSRLAGPRPVGLSCAGDELKGSKQSMGTAYVRAGSRLCSKTYELSFFSKLMTEPMRSVKQKLTGAAGNCIAQLASAFGPTWLLGLCPGCLSLPLVAAQGYHLRLC